MQSMLRISFLLALASLQGVWALDPPFPGASQPCYDVETDGVQGFCEHTDCCAYDYYESGLCPNYPGQVKCCYSKNECAEACTGTCNAESQQIACQILALYEQGQIWLKPEHFNAQGNNPYDGASSLSNIRDTCYGRQVKRSAYENAPGGCVCLQKAMLQTMHDYAVNFYQQNGVPIQINAMAGSSHSSNSWHYEGNTMDVACTTPFYHCEELEDFCRSRGAIELCFPGSSCGGHETWVHCAMPMD
eukprot:maker-scaffold732_size105256-snap-gene-0.15 protein:Tk09371 transcript:maker-scaffold732_size105256-snap-gene-0.15-mRNA-1 annotation:"hypothetical protein DAPPUDRAFT_226094"